MNKGKDNKNAEISARIAAIIDFLGETRNSFATKLGYDRAQTVYDILNMKSAPSYDFFYRFSYTGYSDIINLDWLISGKGEMGKQDDNLKDSKSVSHDTYLIEKVIEQAEEIGVLRERIKQLERGKDESALDAPDSIHANAG